MESRSAELLLLARENKHARDEHISFEESTHTYTVRGQKVGISVTGLIASVETEHFDAPCIAAQLAASARPSERYSTFDEATQTRIPLKAEEILGLWDLARDLGTDLHAKIERALNGLPVVFDSDNAPNAVEFAQFQRWWAEQLAAGYEAYRTEWVIYEGPQLAGSIDFLMKNKATGELSIVDWKRCLTSGSGFSSAWKGKKMLPPLHHLEETKLNHWKVQVNIYRAILEKHYGVKIAEMMMVVLYADQREAVVFTHEREEAAVDALISSLSVPGADPVSL